MNVVRTYWRMYHEIQTERYEQKQFVQGHKLHNNVDPNTHILRNTAAFTQQQTHPCTTMPSQMQLLPSSLQCHCLPIPL